MSKNTERPTAVWIKRNDALHTMECSNCGADAHYQLVNRVWRYEPYCAHCGARVYKQEDLPMSEEKKPRLAEILGVEVGQEFEIDGIDGVFYVDEFGFIQEPCKGRFCPGLSHAINCPDLIKRGPRWTEQEVEDAKAIKRLMPRYTYIGRNDDELWLENRCGETDILAFELFPSLKPGQTVMLADIIGGSE